MFEPGNKSKDKGQIPIREPREPRPRPGGGETDAGERKEAGDPIPPRKPPPQTEDSDSEN